jgi:hypothetical protein
LWLVSLKIVATFGRDLARDLGSVEKRRLSMVVTVFFGVVRDVADFSADFFTPGSVSLDFRGRVALDDDKLR